MADNTKPVTIAELKTFIEAVEFAADVEEWMPSARQWTRIRSMIDRLQEAAPARPAPVEPFRQPQFEGSPTMALPMPSDAGQHRAPSSLLPSPVNLPGPFMQSGGAPVRAPDVDTSNGTPYKTPFA